MKDKISLFINNNINSISFGLLNGFLIFIGIFCLSKFYLITKEIEIANSQLLNNSLLYIPYYFMESNDKQIIFEKITEFKKEINEKEDEEKKNIQNNNKPVEKKLLIIIIVCILVIIIIIIINYKVYNNVKNFKQDLFNSICSSIVILLFEFVLMYVIVLKYWYINVYDIINYVRNNINVDY